MQLSSEAQAIMLMTVPFGRADSPDLKPLSNGEWARFAAWLQDHDLDPSALIKGDRPLLLRGWSDRSVTLPRLEALLGRGAALGLLLERWQRAGLWLLTGTDPDYPERLKQFLQSGAPAVLFGFGNKDLLNRGGIAVVGSRDATGEDLAFAASLGERASAEGRSIISGGARGVDESAMLTALEAGGTAVGVLADSLLRSATTARYRRHLMTGDLALASPYNPEAGFNVGTAMARNRYIYCLADAAVVVTSTRDQGGTWAGATEALKARWIPVWTRPGTAANSGNSDLLRRGAGLLGEPVGSLSALLEGPQPPFETDLPLAPSQPGQLAENPVPGLAAVGQARVEIGSPSPPAGAKDLGADLYEIFVQWLDAAAGASPLTVDDIMERLDLERAQAIAWLRRGVAEGKLRKLARPIRYQSAAGPSRQSSLFDDGV